MEPLFMGKACFESREAPHVLSRHGRSSGILSILISLDQGLARLPWSGSSLAELACLLRSCFFVFFARHTLDGDRQGARAA